MIPASETRSSRLRLTLLGLVAGLIVLRLVAAQFEGDAGPEDTFPGDPLTTAQAQDGGDQKPGRESGKAARPQFTEEEVRVLTELRDQRQELRNRRERVAETEERLQLLRDKMAKDLDRLERYRDQIQTGLDKEQQLQSEKMDHLVQVYANMNPEKAAERIDRMDRVTAVKLLSRMSGEAAGRILSFVDPDKANRISQDMTKMVDDIQ
jgi:flagellar motility protein MotE (MotC chaperone)